MPTKREETPSELPAPSGEGAPSAEQRAADYGRLRRSTLLWARVAAILLAAFLGYELFLVVRGLVGAFLIVLICLLMAAIVAFLGGPVANLLNQRFRVPKTPAVLITLVFGLLIVATVIWLASGPLFTEGRHLAERMPTFVRELDRVVTRLEKLLKSHGIRVNAVSFITSRIGTLAPQLTGFVISGVTGLVGILVDAIVALVLSFWLMKDGKRLRRGFVGLLPTRWAHEVDFAIDAFNVVIGGYVRAQLFLALVIGTLAGIGCALIGVPFPLVVAITAAIFELIPLVGPFAGGAVALLLAFTKSPTTALFTLILFLGIHVIEGYLLVPKIQARFVQLHPLVALLSLFAGIEIAGFLGALVAVPAASFLMVMLRAWVGDWRANRPELFHSRRRERQEEIRYRRLLASFRLFNRVKPSQGGGADPTPPPPK